LKAAGAEVTIVPGGEQGDPLCATFATAQTDHNAASALVLSHFDTVWAVGLLVSRPLRSAAGKAYGPGIFDMQSSLVLAEYADHEHIEVDKIAERAALLVALLLEL
jgi:glutamate carboxypeptidase